MSVADLERQTFGESLTVKERITGGLVVAVGAIGHVALGLAIAVFFAILFGL